MNKNHNTHIINTDAFVALIKSQGADSLYNDLDEAMLMVVGYSAHSGMDMASDAFDLFCTLRQVRAAFKNSQSTISQSATV